MNIKDLEKKEVEKVLKDIDAKDTFDLLLKIGKEYMKKYQSKPIDINTKEGQTEFRRIAWYINEELVEMVNLLKIREWSKTEYPIDELHFAEEYADFMNFVIQIPLLLGWSEEKIKDIIVRKYLINKFRMESLY
jgi:dimeric dUTPase (all-alpha-NTP-PPase superfamily)